MSALCLFRETFTSCVFPFVCFLEKRIPVGIHLSVSNLSRVLGPRNPKGCWSEQLEELMKLYTLS